MNIGSAIRSRVTGHVYIVAAIEPDRIGLRSSDSASEPIWFVSLSEDGWFRKYCEQI